MKIRFVRRKRTELAGDHSRQLEERTEVERTEVEVEIKDNSLSGVHDVLTAIITALQTDQ